jgi:hypothetical protein
MKAELDYPAIATVRLDEEYGRISCQQVSEDLKEANTQDSTDSLQVVMGTLCHYQCSSRAS